MSSSGVLFVAEVRDGELLETSFELLAAARALSAAGAGPVRAAAIGPDPARFADALAREGVEEVVTVATPGDHFEAYVCQAAIAGLIQAEAPAVVVLGHTIDSLAYAPAVAATQQLGLASDVTAVEWRDGLRARRGAFGGKLEAELEFPGKDCVLLLLRAGAFEPGRGGAGKAPVRELALDFGESSAAEHLAFRPPADSEGVDITKSEFLLSIGRGVDDEDEIPRFEALARRLGADLSVSRPIVDAGWASNARQVGQSGKTVKPKVYLALGISGAVQHTAGIRAAETVIAVNTDPDAPIFAVADYGAVADLFEVAEELEQAQG